VLRVNELEEILENRAVDGWAQHFARHPFQINRPHESDAELVDMKGGPHVLAVTIDTISEEIARGVYRDPFTMGWVTVMANLSDLAAVGAQALGIVISVALGPERPESFRNRIAQGMTSACRALDVFILGGDTSAAREVSLTGCAFGFVPSGDKILTRMGGRAGDAVFISGGAGRGNALGVRALMRMPEEVFPEASYRPLARLKEGPLIRKFAASCMDTSDGLFITLDQLMRLNHIGFDIVAGWGSILAPDVQEFCARTEIPPWFMAAGIHGEFELVFTVPQDGVGLFMDEAEKIGFYPVRIGVVQEKPCLTLTLPSGSRTELDMAPLRNLWADPDVSLSRLLEEHHAWGKKWGIEP
jgi:thiamine-monophosphate kinase